MLKKSAIFFILLSLVAAKAYSVNNSPFQMLRYNMSARAAGIAGAFTAMPGDPAALFFNPATVYTVNDKNFGATLFKHVLDINSGQLSYVREFKEIGKLAASVNYTNFGSFEYVSPLGVKNGNTFGGQNLAMGVTYSNELDSNLYWGATGKFIFMSLEEANSLAFAIDAGILYMIPEKRVNIGLSVLHAGSQLSTFDGVSEELPLDVRLGINHRLRGLPLLVNLSFHHLADSEDNFLDRFLNFSIGGEFYFGEFIRARLGYDNHIRNNTTPSGDKKFAGISAGIGLEMESFNLDYALAQVGNAATLHRLSVTLGL